MATRQDIEAVLADSDGDKRGRIARLRAQKLSEQFVGNLPFTWKPVANVLVIIKDVSLRGNAIELVVDLTIRGVTKSLSTWMEGKHSTPDWRIVNPPLFVDDPTGDVTITDGVTTRHGRDDIVASLKQVFADTFGDRIAALLRNGAAKQ